ncbi:MAG: RdgB/HAM1 family non-canonical purine NTP pyrophosphatase [Proteobacteria bacterium]|nr:RdgB/HAM1 family non-canonical purine NTP pyrophosphatase [Pseudomonadota bacterium]
MATRNPGKIRELEAILQDSGVSLLSLADFPLLPEIPEEGATFAENAAAKALAVARLTGHPALADDSGLMVDALGGAPGVFSARYAQDRTAPGPPTDADNWGKLLAELKNVPMGERGARFVCELVLATPDGRLLRARGECAGVIAFAPQGETGFGYDPVFWVAEYAATMAQLGPEIKNKISHRAMALAAFKTLLRSWLQEQETGGSGSVTTNSA